jgi:hypothetical protein
MLLASLRASSLLSSLAAERRPGSIAVLPDRKCSPDIMNRCTECAEREAPANDREQHGRFHAVDLLLVDVKLVGEVGHGKSPLLPSLQNDMDHVFSS